MTEKEVRNSLLDSLKTANEEREKEKYKMFSDTGKIEKIDKRIYILNECVKLVEHKQCTVNQLHKIDAYLTRELHKTIYNMCNMKSDEDKSRRKLLFKKKMYIFLKEEIRKRLLNCRKE